MKENIYKVHNIDARLIDSVIMGKVIDVTITSPPYFNLKDYGSDEQIGFGQNYEDYLEDLKLVFEKVYKITKDSGTLWVVIDAYRKNGEVVPLPFDFSNRIKEVGWKLQEIIIWKKDKTVPWAHNGQMRNIFEYILVFSKSPTFNFHLDRIRDFKSLKRWWVKYPERYNPKGKAPEAIWEFGIPVQGSWGNGYIDHFCPLPEDLIGQILKITTDEKDVVLDCFAGSGAVLAKAESMRRKFIGFELNSQYIKKFKKYQKEYLPEKKEDYLFEEKYTFDQTEFQKLIINLRILKFSRLLLRELKKDGITEDLAFYVKQRKIVPSKNYIAGISIFIYTKNRKTVQDQIDSRTQIQPLSKFGLEAKILYTSNFEEFKAKIKRKYIFKYTDKVSHRSKGKIMTESLNNEKFLLLSNILVNLNEQDYH